MSLTYIVPRRRRTTRSARMLLLTLDSRGRSIRRSFLRDILRRMVERWLAPVEGVRLPIVVELRDGGDAWMHASTVSGRRSYVVLDAALIERLRFDPTSAETHAQVHGRMQELVAALGVELPAEHRSVDEPIIIP